MKRHGKRQPGRPVVPVPASTPPKLPKGRYARVWLSGEFLAWCQRHYFKPAGIAPCVLHTEALQSSAAVVCVHRSRPDELGDLYDLRALARAERQKKKEGRTDGR